MRRREFLAVAGGAAAALLEPRAVHAQQGAMPVIGYLYSGAIETGASWVTAFRQGLSEEGFSEGHNVAIEYRWANNDPARLPGLAADLVGRRVAVGGEGVRGCLRWRDLDRIADHRAEAADRE